MDTVGTLSLCPHQRDSVIEGVQSNAPSLLLFSALSPRSERLAGNMFICAWDLAAFRCHRGVRYRGVSVRRGLSVI